jgi:hypothetical protein
LAIGCRYVRLVHFEIAGRSPLIEGMFPSRDFLLCPLGVQEKIRLPFAVRAR